MDHCHAELSTCLWKVVRIKSCLSVQILFEVWGLSTTRSLRSVLNSDPDVKKHQVIDHIRCSEYFCHCPFQSLPSLLSIYSLDRDFGSLNASAVVCSPHQT